MATSYKTCRLTHLPTCSEHITKLDLSSLCNKESKDLYVLVFAGLTYIYIYRYIFFMVQTLHKSEWKNQPSVNQLLKSIRMFKADRNNSSNFSALQQGSEVCWRSRFSQKFKEIQQRCFKLCAAYTRTEILNLV
jgi:hypothetical protein